MRIRVNVFGIFARRVDFRYSCTKKGKLRKDGFFFGGIGFEPKAKSFQSRRSIT
jgi:hypothetical protein